MKRSLIAAAVVIFAALASPARAAINPFMDVPASHWAYDAIAQLAARGVISGYPDGAYKGAKPTTRYEMASALARELAVIDMQKASKQDAEMLARLIAEFTDELRALGVNVDKIDSRLAVLEQDLGGWGISGSFRFDAKFMGDNGSLHGNYSNTAVDQKNDFNLSRYRISLRKRINETTSFAARLGPGVRAGNGRAEVRWERYAITTKLGWDITMHAGVLAFDWEGQYRLYNGRFMDDAWFGETGSIAAFHFIKDWGKPRLELVVGRRNDNYGIHPVAAAPGRETPSLYEQYLISALAHYDFSERFGAGLFGYFQFSDSDERTVTYSNGAPAVDVNNSLTTYGAFLNYRFDPAVELKGIYYHQSQGAGYAGDDSAKMWRVILDVRQRALKFTSLWLEYGQIDNNFVRLGSLNSWGYYGVSNSMGDVVARGAIDRTRTLWAIRADQQWSPKWRTFASYRQIDFGSSGIDDMKNWNIGVAYRLNPAVEFELAYDNVDWGASYDDGMIRFRTSVNF